MPGKFKITFKQEELHGEYPTKCPICHHKITLGNAAHIIPRDQDVQATYVCPNEDCQSIFISYYTPSEDEKYLKLDHYVPVRPEIEEFPETIKNISPLFDSIYLEAEDARLRKFTQIAGPGFRKAFEFLIKDYAKHTVRDQETDRDKKYQEIEASFSGKVVKNFIKDPRIQAVAERALWLGNDETHYLRKWEEHNIDDLITLIRLTINWIEIEQLSAKYTNEMVKK